MHKWVVITLCPRDDPRRVRHDELMILYAMVNKIRVSPAKAMVKQWCGGEDGVVARTA